MKNKLRTLRILLMACITVVSCHDDGIDNTNPLIANAGPDKQVVVGETVILDGSNSTNTKAEGFSYNWNLKSKPTNSVAQLENRNKYNPNFLADKSGVYVLVLEIMKDNWSAIDEVQITASDVATQPTIISQDITSDMVLNNIHLDDYQMVDYLITQPINLEAKLTIMPGVRVAFAQDASLVVKQQGSLISEGGTTEEDRIYLTGHQNNPGYWKGIYFQSQNPNNKFIQTELSYAGGNSNWSAEPIGLYLEDNSILAIDHSYFINNLGKQVYYSNLAQIKTFDNNYLSGVENNTHVLGIPVTEVVNLGDNNQFWNGDIAVTTAILDSGENLIWPSYLYSLLSGLKLMNGTALTIPDYTQIRVAEDKRIDILNGSQLKAIASFSGNITFSGIEDIQGYWKGIYIEHSNNIPSAFKYVQIKNAGSAPLAGDKAATVHLGAYGIMSMDYCSINFGGGDGIEATSEGATILSFVENSIRGHQGYPIAVSTKNVAVLDYYSFFSNNEKNQVRVDGNYPIAFTQEVIWKGFNQTTMSYHINGLGKDLTIWSGLKLMPGVIIEMEENSRIVVETANGTEGYLKAIGNTAKPIIIKNKMEIAGSWYGITFSNLQTNNQLNYVQIFHGGKLVSNSFSANIIIDNSPKGRLDISNTIIGYSSEHGIAVYNEDRNNLIDSNITYLGILGNNIYEW